MVGALGVDIKCYQELLGLDDLTNKIYLYLRTQNIQLQSYQIGKMMGGLPTDLQYVSDSGDRDIRQRGRQPAQRVRDMVDGNERLEDCYKELVAGTVFAD